MLDDDDAISATVGALYGAVAHTDRLYDATRLRAWLYALARAESQSRLAGVAHKGSYARQGRGGSPELAVEVLACLEPREREILDLTLRHGLKSDEVARVLDISVDGVESAARLGRRHAEQWLAAVMDARGETPKCSVLPDLVKSWADSPTRLLRAHISRHVRSCKDCQGAPPSVTMTALMTRMPILASPAPSEHLFAGADSSFTAAETRTESWHPDGFPVQPDVLEDPPPPEAPLTVEEGFTPERPAGAKPPPEFWEPDPEADDPESRIRWGRVGLVTLVSVASTAVIWSLLFNPSGGKPVEVEAAGGTVVVTPGDSLPPLVDSPPPPPPGGTSAPVSTVPRLPGATRPGVAQPTSSVPVVPPPTSSRPTASPTKSKTKSPTTNNGPKDPPPPPKTSRPTASSSPKSSPKQSSQPQTKQSTSAPPPPPPPPPPPSFAASSTSVTVPSGGYQGSVSVRSGAGSITWKAVGRNIIVSPGSGSTGSGQSSTISFTVSGCGKTGEAYMSISWSGDNQGTKGSGTIGVDISYSKPC
ncbi:RNA polymerase sigma factor [Sphaerisporangium corydalis]|uniref:Sigma factor-like helix-turn-helix DNA-binding protein n=1 Tax=Sphaerisporangium corydalis TaxID=1441875 RepID=A0ABV9ELL0_9ACTN|nr:sigma factor-like helix-turn-helix DNA-binding protein [Sphaerisporangium corydalis]